MDAGMARRSTKARRARRIAHSLSFPPDPQDEVCGKTEVAPMPWHMFFPGRYDRIRSRCGADDAQSMAEYAVVLGVITPAIVIVYGLFSRDIVSLLDTVRAIFS
jgi:Flp pilus assembly pilin Flp